MAIETLEGTVEEENEGRIDLFVRTLLPLSRSKLKGLFDNDCVTLNDRPCKDPAERVSTGDRVSVNFDPHQGYSAKKRPWSDRTFAIIHEDKELLVINKSAGVLTVPTPKKEENTLVERLTMYLSRKKKNSEAIVVHRMDREASGVLVVAKTPESAASLRAQFSADTPKIIYVAIVRGVVEKDTQTIESVLETHKNLNRYSVKDKTDGTVATTRVTALKRLEDATSVELELVTARRHQARVHLFEAGHQVLGDPRYGNDLKKHGRWVRKRLAMHCVSLTIEHPANGESVTFKSQLPTPMRKFLRGS